MIDDIYVIKKPLVTEKSTQAMNEHGRYTFQVDPRCTKDEIKAAIQRLYGVKVEKIATQVRKGETRRLKYGYVTGAKTKTAVVRLQEGQAIELF